MKEEINMIEKNKTWELVDLSNKKDVIGLKWIYKTKFNEDGSVKKYKARLVAKGYSQQPGIDFNETFAPVARIETIRTALAIATNFELKVYQLDEIFLGIQVVQGKGRIFLSQEKYIENLLERFHMAKCKPVSTPMMFNEKLQQKDGAYQADASLFRSLVGSLIYVTHTRPDIAFAVSVVSRYMTNPSKTHFTAAKRILRYLQGTKKQGILYEKDDECKLLGYSDSDWAGSVDDRKSTSGYIFCLGSKVISWSSRKQKTVALSSSEAEYTAITDAACQAVWLRRLLEDLQLKQAEATTIFCDNKSAILMTKNPVFHARSKHIELRHHFVRDLVGKEDINIDYISTSEQPADILTKAVTFEKFEKHKSQLKITN
ncbi:hypothetical protein DH2020_042591 [Rehmannia glutinosa]|uniref:Reverse transcriptase Ty1/copia-type domain-containing protein n=1 Tax=Rehmannia glutinosa TaxID=99300 RepID=A0ABR0UMU5_REHGL